MIPRMIPQGRLFRRAPAIGVNSQDKHHMKVGWKARISFYAYKYVTGPLLNIIVVLFQGFFIFLDKVTGNEVPPISDEEALQEYRDQTNLSVDNVPIEFQTLLPLAIKWGIGDDALRGDVVEAATEFEKHELASALTRKLYAIDKWIDSFPEGSISDEAATFMYMIKAVEELGLHVEYE
jgi:hypothetical protein